MKHIDLMLYPFDNTWCDGIVRWRLTDAHGEHTIYTAPADWQYGVMVGKSILFDRDWTNDSNYRMEVEIGDNWHLVCEQ